MSERETTYSLQPESVVSLVSPDRRTVINVRVQPSASFSGIIDTTWDEPGDGGVTNVEIVIHLEPDVTERTYRYPYLDSDQVT